MFSAIFSSKIELVPFSNRKIDVFDDFFNAHLPKTTLYIKNQNYLLFTDDDVHFFLNHLYTNLILLLSEATSNTTNSKNSPKNYLIGSIKWNDPPLRHPYADSVTKNQWPFDIYPPFSTGMGTLLSPNSAILMYEMSKIVPLKLTNVDDVYLSSLAYFNNFEILKNHVKNESESRNVENDENHENYIHFRSDVRFNTNYEYWEESFNCLYFNVHGHVGLDLERKREERCG